MKNQQDWNKNGWLKDSKYGGWYNRMVGKVKIYHYDERDLSQ